MSLKIVIDGYNLLNISFSLQCLAVKDLAAARNKLLRSLDQYRRVSRHQLTVVFDGWRKGYLSENREIIGQIEVIYSRQGEKADEVINRLAQARTASVVVTSDRELANSVQRYGATVIPSQQFDARLRARSETATSVPPFKDDEEDRPAPGKKKGPARRLSRQARRCRATLGKL